MKKSRTRISLFKITLAVLIAGIAAGAVYCWHLSDEINKRFSGRRWSIPSRVLSDTTLLYPGQYINQQDLEEKLIRLGYRRVTGAVEHKGDMNLEESVLSLHLNDLTLPLRSRPGFPVRLLIQKNTLKSIIHITSGESIPLLELEPEELALMFGPHREQRRLISIEHVPRHVIQAVLAAEDSRFYHHFGFDPAGILRAFLANIRSGAVRQGGSTITQQLAKNYFLTAERSMSRKIKEFFMAVTMEIMYSKDVILEIYLNEIYFGQQGTVSINGIGEASFFYFGRPVSALSLSEAATIAGLIRSPGIYSPHKHVMRSQERRDSVLGAMHEHRWITPHEYETALVSPLHSRQYITYGKRAPYFIDYLSRQLSDLYPPEALTGEGFSIHTTLDSHVQKAAEEALNHGLAHLEKTHPALTRNEPDKRLQGAIIVMQPSTGYILAMVGGRDYVESQFNRITQARRQPGSTFKPFVFLSALEHFSPATLLFNEEKTYQVEGKDWTPQNYAPISEIQITMRTALSLSVNRAAVDLAMRTGLDTIIHTARLCGFTSPLRPYPSLTLGSFEVTPLELARAFCVFAAEGNLSHPLSLKEVVDEQGIVLERRHLAVTSVSSPAKIFIMNSLLRSVVEEGTARSLRELGISFPVAGKTGTTNDYRDAWFVGYTPEVLALVWVGFDDGAPLHLSGSEAALPMWAELMRSIPQYSSRSWFRMPPGVVKKTICPESGNIALVSRCPAPAEEYFLDSLQPLESCELHKSSKPLKQLIRRIKKIFETLQK